MRDGFSLSSKLESRISILSPKESERMDEEVNHRISESRLRPKLTENFFSDDKTDEGMVQAIRPESMEKR